MNKLKRLLTLAFLMGLTLSAVTGCRTAHGFGEDLESAGKGIQEGTQ